MTLEEIVRTIRDELAAFGATGSTDALDHAADITDQVLHSDTFAVLPDRVRALLWGLGASTLMTRARSDAARVDDLDLAIEWLTAAGPAASSDEAERGRLQANLATALVDRFGQRGNVEDLRRALPHFEAATTSLAGVGAPLHLVRHSHGLGLHELAAAGVDPQVHLRKAVELHRAARDDPHADGFTRAGYCNSLGLSLRRLGLATSDVTVLRCAEQAYREAVALSRDPQAAVPARANLAVLVLDLADLDGGPDRVREAVEIYREILPLTDEDTRGQVLANLAGALVSAYRYSRDRTHLDEALHRLRTVTDALRGGSLHEVALAALAGALHEMFDHTGALLFLDEAIAVQASVLEPPHPRTPERTLNHGISLVARFRRRRDRNDLDRASALFNETVTNGAGTVRASALNSHANARSLAFDVSGETAEIERAVRLRERAVAAAVPGSLDEATYRGNLGVDLLKRFETTGDRGDLDRAIAEGYLAVSVVPPSSSDQPRLLAGLADSLARRSFEDPEPDAAAEVRSAYRVATSAGLASLPEQALGAALRWGDWESRQSCWVEAAEPYLLALGATTVLVARQRQRADKEDWLVDARTVPAAAALALRRAQDPSGAALALERGRAILLAEALGSS